MAFDVNTRLGHYEIRSLLGKGGMGEVYLALDVRLRRLTALKLLTSDLTKDEEWLRRFEQEAYAASALNHPNILTIYEIGHIADTHFIAAEFIDGDTLRQRVRDSRITLFEAVDIAVQIASALAAAHAAGVVHRDVKPENIMLRRDGYAKVLDFGLAKLTENRFPTADPHAATIQVVKTEPGVIMGTASYMSPEQARGLDVDARTDIFSFGVVLYEMITGRPPFEGPTTSDLIVSLLDREPPPLTLYSPMVPAELQRIVSKALAKDREERYQTIKDLAIDLRRLKPQLEIGVMPEAPIATTIENDGAASGSARQGQSTARATNFETVRTSLINIGRWVNRSRQSKRNAILTGALVALILAGVSLAIQRLLDRQRRAASANFFQTMRVMRLTTNGKVRHAAVSPDGKYVIQVLDDKGLQSLWVRQVSTASDVQVAAPAQAQYGALTFSRDGNYVYYLKRENHAAINALYQMPVFGGASKKLILDLDTTIAFSPDGARLIFVRNYPHQGESALMVANADGTEERKLAVRKRPEIFAWPAWSPDGKVIACGVRSLVGGLHMSVIGMPAGGGAGKVFTAQRWSSIGGVVWLGDSGGLVLVGADESSKLSQIWRVSYPDGEAQRVTNDLSEYRGVSLTADSTALVTVRTDRLANIWAGAPELRTDRFEQITSGQYDASRLSWTPDGKIIYVSLAGGTRDLWIMNPDGTDQRQLTSDALPDSSPSVTNDGRYIVFASNRTGTYNIWRVDADGSNLTQLTSGKYDGEPVCSPDDQWVVYMSWNSDKPTLWKVSIGGGQPVQLINVVSVLPAVSPDNQLIACQAYDEQTSQWRVAILPFEGGEFVQTYDLPPTVSSPAAVQWTRDGKGLTYVDTRGGISNIWGLTLSNGAAKQITNFEVDRIFWFAWSKDGKQLAVSRGSESSDAVMLKTLP